MINKTEEELKKLREHHNCNIIRIQNEYLKNLEKKFGKKFNDIDNYRYELENGKLSSTCEEKVSNENPKIDSMTLYKNKLKKIEKNNKREYSASEIMMTTKDDNEKNTDNNPILSKMKMVSKVSSSKELDSLMNNKFINLRSIKINKKRAKKVTFKKNFVNIVEIESYKKYNIDNNLTPNDKADTKCTCLIF